MSSREWTFRIEDILKAIKKVDSYVKGLTFAQFKSVDLKIVWHTAKKHLPSLEKQLATILKK